MTRKETQKNGREGPSLYPILGTPKFDSVTQNEKVIKVLLWPSVERPTLHMKIFIYFSLVMLDLFKPTHPPRRREKKV
jgi:hypothetical protein